MTQLKTNLKVSISISPDEPYIDNERKHMVRSRFTILPESPFKTSWDILGFIFIVYQSILIPFTICFDAEPTGVFKRFDNIIDTFFLLDICKIISKPINYISYQLQYWIL
jgi:hypothetical protein